MGIPECLFMVSERQFGSTGKLGRRAFVRGRILITFHGMVIGSCYVFFLNILLHYGTHVDSSFITYLSEFKIYYRNVELQMILWIFHADISRRPKRCEIIF